MPTAPVALRGPSGAPLSGVTPSSLGTRAPKNDSVTSPSAPRPVTIPLARTAAPDHRSPRWLGAVSGVLLLLSAGAVVATVDSLWRLFV